MAACEKLAKCPFYQGKMSMDTGIGAMYKNKYCEGDNSTCARYMVATQAGPDYITDKLYPNMVQQAEEIIKQSKK